MGEKENETKTVRTLINDAITDSSLRTMLSQDRSAQEFAESANKRGYEISPKDAQKILAGALLTSDSVSSDEKNNLIGGLAWNFLDKIENKLDGDFRLLQKKDTWKRTKDFYENVFE